MKTFFRWAVRITVTLVFLFIVLVVVAVLLKDVIAKSLAERNLRDNTGMDAKISKLEVGLATPTISLEDLKLYNTEQFGGGTFLQMPELRVEYAPEDLRSGTLHFKTVRLNLAEVHIIKNKNGKTNIDALDKEVKKRARRHKDKSGKLDVDFTIDTLYLTIGKIRITDEGDPRNNEVIDVGLKEEVGKNLKSEEAINDWFKVALFRRAMADYVTTPAEVREERFRKLSRIFGMDIWSRPMGGKRAK
jgi:uncharacterized protein involved in outer membrane biogenesis